MSIQKIAATFSWDDGHPLDLRMARLFNKYELSCTFFVPKNNSENLQTLGKGDLKVLARDKFDIHSHTYNHVYLSRLAEERQKSEIRDGKKYIEDTIGKEDNIFCYPGGKFSPTTVRLVQEAGFAYARTIDMGHIRALSHDNYLMPTTMIISPLTIIQVFKHVTKRLALGRSYNILRVNRAVINQTWSPKKLSPVYYHFWGHSWEIEKYQLWGCLEVLIKSLLASDIEIISNNEFYEQRGN